MNSAVLQFKEWDAPAGVSSSVLFDAGLMSGIYILGFANGEEYVGKTVNFPRRFTDHRRRWPDIVFVRFAPVLPENLDRMERAVVSEREAAGVILRNLLLLAQPLGPSRLDVLIDKQAQAEWLTAGADYQGLAVDPHRTRVARRRMRSRQNLDRLMRHPKAHQVISAVAAYVGKVIPSPDLGEGGLWTLTAVPGTSRGPTNRRLATLSIQNVEVMFLGEHKDEAGEWRPYSVLNISDRGELPDDVSGHFEAHNGYRSAGTVRAAWLEGLHAIPELLDIPEVLLAARSLALGQLRKGRGAFSGYHNDAFADAVFVEIGASVDPQ
ncbi:GIY-YIG nuclease family protein [Kocuria tytonicola]|uniref:GIY-YIG nuclease family protein n=1 Tax=Kocuria tytonicola TaxID=2055946 RepID=UPI000F521911|nr:GIY-YIG nuclease family protein [Kocuria tytonicola]